LTIVDYLMRFTNFRGIESYFKGDKWKHYDKKVSHLVQCMGDILDDDCRDYRETGCTHLWQSGDVRLDELVWCKQYYDRVPRIPMGAWLRNGCVPDEDWEDPDGDHCEDYAGVLIEKDAFEVQGSGGKNPVDACCAMHHKFKGIIFAPAHGQADEDDEPATAWKLPAHVWKLNGCVADDYWKDRDGRTCHFYEGRDFFDWDWLSKDLGVRSLTPMEACCLDEVRGRIVYSPDLGTWRTDFGRSDQVGPRLGK